nr:unnamed protein product [Callosobruchus analis]
MNLINFHWIQNAPYIQRSFLRSLKQWSSSLARNLTPIQGVPERRSHRRTPISLSQNIANKHNIPIYQVAPFDRERASKSRIIFQFLLITSQRHFRFE